MRMSKLFFQTLREVPADAEIISHQLMLRAGLMRQLAAGLFDFMPIGMRIKRKIEEIFREEMDAIGGQEILMPVVNSADVWKETGRWYEIGDDMARFKDRGDRDMCLAMTHEEAITDLVRQVISSYRQLPLVLYHIQTKFRDEPRPRAGMIRVREFTMKDAYSFDRDLAGLDEFYPKAYQAYFNIFRRCGIEPVAVEADVGMMGGTMASTNLWPSPPLGKTRC
ncbi:MAG: aminoacyl--tRNA ligase-related protein [Caldilineaceae bacterium]